MATLPSETEQLSIIGNSVTISNAVKVIDCTSEMSGNKSVVNVDTINNTQFNSNLETETDGNANSVKPENVISEMEFVQPSSPLGDSFAENSSKLQSLNIEKTTDDTVTTSEKDFSFKPEIFNFKFNALSNPTPAGNKFSVTSENLPSSSTKTIESLSSGLIAECAKPDILSKETDSKSTLVVSRKQLYPPVGNITDTMPMKLGDFISEDTDSVSKCNIGLSSNSSQDKLSSQLGNLTFENSNEKHTVPSGTRLEFKPVLGSDTMTVINTVKVRYQCINMMEEYSSKCLEELRSEYYKENRKGVKSEDFTLKTGGYFVPNTTTKFEFQDFVPNTMPSNFHFPATGTNGVRKLMEGIKGLLDSGKHSDLILNVQGKEFNVHKNILSIWSPVFSDLIENRTKENATGVVNIDDCDPDTFSDFLHFLYTGSAKKINAKNVSNMYEIARKYQVLELSMICVNYMKNNNPEQTCQIS